MGADARSDGVPPGPGVYVLGMHRSGTSVLAGVVDLLGLDGGPRQSMVAADKFNSDGYWEQRPLVRWHDQVLSHLRGWASAPPPVPAPEEMQAAVDRFGSGPEDLIGDLFSDRWFVKDPRQCLLLWLWNARRGEQDVALAVFREPAAVARSLATRNRYPAELSVALWERYCHDLLRHLDGRPCLVLRYEDLVADPGHWVGTIASTLDAHLGAETGRFASRVEEAAALVRPGQAPAEAGCALEPEQQALRHLLAPLSGWHPSLDLGAALPPLSAAGTALIARRRSRLNVVRPLAHSADLKARLDRIPAVLRNLRRP